MKMAHPQRSEKMSDLEDLATIDPIRVWDHVIARRVEGERITFAVVELEPDAVVPEHRHPNEQIGMVISGEVRFRVGDDERHLQPGGTWRILSNVPHSCVVGPEGAVLIDVFSPIRADWNVLDVLEPAAPLWPV
jgi:quercetin dioxygenase-like cupin family protein